jgi:three-Cys-motif partner protein
MSAMAGKGGLWTEKKLEALQKYMSAFNVALKDMPPGNKKFRRFYIDAFAGSGSRPLEHLPLLGEHADIAQFAKGSAQLALECHLPFDQYVFIEKSSENIESLRSLAAQRSDRSVIIHKGDANQKLVAFLRSWDRRNNRGVLFIDPYGCQVEFSTLKAIAATQSIDVWILFPTNGIRRMLPNNGEFQIGWQSRLTTLFGTSEWFEKFYPKKELSDLFGNAGEGRERTVTLDGIDNYYRKQLESVFQGGVAKGTLPLGIEGKERLFSLFFACSNPSAAAKGLSHKLANQIMKSV